MDVIDLHDLKIVNKESSKSNVKLFAFEGKITNSNSYELNRRFMEVFEDGVYNLVIDLSKLDYVNSTGVAIIFTIFYRAAENGGRVSIGGLHPFLQKVFSLMELPKGFSVYDNAQAAIDSF